MNPTQTVLAGNLRIERPHYSVPASEGGLSADELLSYTAGRTQFSTTIPGLQTAWDSTSMSALKRCPRYYQYMILQGLRPKSEALPLIFGIHYHTGHEIYAKQIAQGATPEQALSATVRYVLSATWDRGWSLSCSACQTTVFKYIENSAHCGSSDISGLTECPHCAAKFVLEADAAGADLADSSPASLSPDSDIVAEAGTALFTEVSDNHRTASLIKTEISAPWETTDTRRSRITLLRSIIWYYEHYKNDMVNTVTLATGKPAVELSVKLPTGVFSPANEEYYLCAHFDRIVEFAGDLYVADHKSSTFALTGDYFTKYSPDNQMSAYPFLANVTLGIPVRGVLIDAVQIGVGFSRFQRGPAHRTKSQLEEWFTGWKSFIRRAEDFAAERYWPMNEASCGNFGGCAFREVCSKSPESRHTFLQSNYFFVDWNPLKSR